MHIALGADEPAPVVDSIAELLEQAGHRVTRFGKAAGEDEAWGATGRRVAEAVVKGVCERGVVLCWTGTGVSMAANKVPGARAALCVDAATAAGARKWNDANVLALSLRLTSAEVAKEIVQAFLSEPYGQTEGPSLAELSALDAERREP
jgi:ribose 5-phosphate isomerase B